LLAGIDMNPALAFKETKKNRPRKHGPTTAQGVAVCGFVLARTILLGFVDGRDDEATC
jgi:hypothetical protein